MSARRVAVTGVGMVSAVGATAAASFDALLAGRSGLRLHTPEHAPLPLAVPAGTCADFDPAAALGRARAGTLDRYSQLGVAAGLAAWRDAGLAEAPEGNRDAWGVAWGTSLGGTLTFERGYRELFAAGRDRLAPLTVVQAMTNACASHLAIGLGLGGACTTYSVACASAAIAIGEGLRRVRSGSAPVVLAGGSDAPLAFGVIRAWLALQVLAPGDDHSASAACRPFQAARAGLVLAEGAGALVLEDWEHARARGARIYAELAGFGESCDRVNLVRPDRDGQARALRAAMADAGLQAAQVDYVNAHATGTREGDAVEIAALAAVLGEHAPGVAVSATKSALGHPLGAAGALEAVATVLALHHGAIPPTLGSAADLDPACAGVAHVFGAARRGAPLRAALSNSFAFGGSNAVLAFRATARLSRGGAAAKLPGDTMASLPPSTQLAPAAEPALLEELAGLITAELNLDVPPADIAPEAPLYGEGLGLDSIDILELALVVSRRYGVRLRSDQEDNAVIFGSLSNLARYIAQNRTK